MFAGGRRRSSDNVRAMQLFHELKQQFPTIPDHVVTACIANNDQRPADHVLREVLEAASTLQQELMGRNPADRHLLSPTPDVPNQQPDKNISHALNNRGIDQRLAKRKTLEHTTKENVNQQTGVAKNSFKNSDILDCIKENLDTTERPANSKENLEYCTKEPTNSKDNLSFCKDTKETTNRNLKSKNLSSHKRVTPVKTEEYLIKDHDKLENNLPFHKITNDTSEFSPLLSQNSVCIGKGFSTFDKNFLLGNKSVSENLKKCSSNKHAEENQRKCPKIRSNKFRNHKVLNNALDQQKENSCNNEEIQEEQADKESIVTNEYNKSKETNSNLRNLRRRREKFAAYKESASEPPIVEEHDGNLKTNHSKSGANRSSLNTAREYSHHQRLRTDMNHSESDLNRNIIPKTEHANPKKLPPPKRPDTLDLKSHHNPTTNYFSRFNKSENDPSSKVKSDQDYSSRINSDQESGNSSCRFKSDQDSPNSSGRIKGELLNASCRSEQEPTNSNRIKGEEESVNASCRFKTEPETTNSSCGNKSDEADCRIQQSEKCANVFKLLHSNKPPKSPGTPKRQLNKRLVKPSEKTETAETPTQTTSTLPEATPPNLNLSLNVNYSVGVVPPKHTTALHVVPQQPWLPELASPRSFTSVNLTLRPPSSEPQPPIDITSQNSSLTYSTSTFDSQKGLQSKLQITVSPTGGCVSSIRTRPRSYHSGDISIMEPVPQHRTGSVQDLTLSPTIQKQQARIEKLRIELRLENVRLVALQSEVLKLEAARNDSAIERTDAELEKQLLREIRHLRGQCERLTVDVDRQTENAAPLGETSEEFYRNIYTGQRGPFNFNFIDQRMTATSTSSNSNTGRNRLQQQQALLPQAENYGPKWSCSVCTFQNHPLLDSCEQCDMARIVQGTPKPPDLSYLLNMQASLKPKQIVTAANNLLQHVTNNASPEYLRRHSESIHDNENADTPNTLNNTH